jgi:hypothetical protein
MAKNDKPKGKFMKDHSDSSPNPPPKPASKGNGKAGGTVQVRHRKLAALIARGVPLSLAAQQAGLSGSRAYHLVADKDSLVNAEIERISNEIFRAQDALLLSLYRKALEELEALLLSDNPRTSLRAIDLIIKLFLERTTNVESPVLQELFGSQAQGHQNRIEPSMDELVMEKARKRQNGKRIVEGGVL